MSTVMATQQVRSHGDNLSLWSPVHGGSGVRTSGSSAAAAAVTSEWHMTVEILTNRNGRQHRVTVEQWPPRDERAPSGHTAVIGSNARPPRSAIYFSSLSPNVAVAISRWRPGVGKSTGDDIRRWRRPGRPRTSAARLPIFGRSVGPSVCLTPPPDRRWQDWHSGNTITRAGTHRLPTPDLGRFCTADVSREKCICYLWHVSVNSTN